MLHLRINGNSLSCEVRGMRYSTRLAPGLLAVAVCMTAAACGTEKSSNPLSPSVAGPIAGVTITAPKTLEPTNGLEIKTGQTIVLKLENASSNSQRPFWHELDVATDVAFAAKVVTVAKINPGSDGRAAYTVAQPLAAGKVYYWRVRALDGANTGPYSAVANFKVVEPVTIAALAPVSPANGETIASNTPTLVARNGAVTGPAGAVTVRFELAADAGFGQMIAVWSAPRAGGDTTSVQGTPLTAGREYFWRAQASDGTVTSPYSAATSFRTPAETPAPPPPTPNPPNPPPGGGGGPWPTNGQAVLEYVTRNYSQYLRPTGSLDERRHNMEILRDHMIASGICGGMQLGRNLKRGGPEISHDYLVERIGGRWVGVDIGHDFDNIGRPLQLTWAHMPDDAYATYGGFDGPLPCR